MFRSRQIITEGARLCSVRQNVSNKARKQTCTPIPTMDTSKFKLPCKFGTGGKSVWVEYAELVAQFKPQVNLGQGFPDYNPPQNVTDALLEIAKSDNPAMHQYTRGYGHPRLVQALSKLYSPLMGRQINPNTEFLITTGAYEALYCAILGHVDVGDEVIVIEPFFDCYKYMIQMTGGVGRYITLKPNKKCDVISAADWVLDEAELARMFNPKTKMIILNTPHNPLGKIFNRHELEVIADLCKKHNVLCVSDEVYEWMVFEPHKHIRIGSLPGMWERTITIGSAGKMFSVTGWKIGWAYGPANIMHNLMMVHQNCVYTCSTPIQEALARTLEFETARFNKPECYMNAISKELSPKKEILIESLKRNGFKVTVPDGGYFVVADWTSLAKKVDMSGETDKWRDLKFTKAFAKQASVMAIPPTVFYSDEHKHLGEDYVRFCYAKKDEVLTLADKLITDWNAKTQ